MLPAETTGWVAPPQPPSEDVPRKHPATSPSCDSLVRSHAQSVNGATNRFPSKPDRPNPQSQSFSRGYGSSLPTSLTYINLSTRGCSPRRPDADMGTSWHEGVHPSPWIFKSLTGVARTSQEPRRSSGPRPSLRPIRFTRPSAP